MLDPRARRIADNESRFREINERLESDLRQLPRNDEQIEFVCECGHGDCAASVRLSTEEYERVRSEPVLFVMLPGHQIPDVEDVVAETDRYLVARKKPEAWPVVEKSDTRDRG